MKPTQSARRSTSSMSCDEMRTVQVRSPDTSSRPRIELVPDEWIESGERLVEHDQVRSICERRQEGCLHTGPARECAEGRACREAEIRLELSAQRLVPGRIERAAIVEQLARRHPLRHLLVFGDVADALELVGAETTGVGAEHCRPAARRAQEVHQQLERRRLSGAVGAEEREDAAGRHLQVQAFDRLRPPETAGQVEGFDGVGHQQISPHSPWSSVPDQWRLIAAMRSFSGMPARLASITSRSASCSRMARRSAEAPGRDSATTVPISRPHGQQSLFGERAHDLWAVLGLIFSARLSARTEGNGLPARSWPVTTARLTA